MITTNHFGAYWQEGGETVTEDVAVMSAMTELRVPFWLMHLWLSLGAKLVNKTYPRGEKKKKEEKKKIVRKREKEKEKEQKIQTEVMRSSRGVVGVLNGFVVVAPAIPIQTDRDIPSAMGKQGEKGRERE